MATKDARYTLTTHNIFNLHNDYSKELATIANNLDDARRWCERDGATMFWPQQDGIIVAANKHREAIHVIEPATKGPTR